MENGNQSKNILVRIGRCIKFWRKLDGHDQEKFSKALNTARSYVSRLETGHVGVSISRINEVADVLGISPFTILRGVPEKKELDTLIELYRSPDLKISKPELEQLFCTRIEGKRLTREFYVNLLSIIRSGVYTCDA